MCNDSLWLKILICNFDFLIFEDEDEDKLLGLTYLQLKDFMALDNA